MERLPGLGCQAEWQRGEVGLIGRCVVKARMRSAAIVEVEVAADCGAGFGHAVVGVQVHLLVFDAAPQQQLDSSFFTSDYPVAIEAGSDPRVLNRIISPAPDLAKVREHSLGNLLDIEIVTCQYLLSYSRPHV